VPLSVPQLVLEQQRLLAFLQLHLQRWQLELVRLRLLVRGSSLLLPLLQVLAQLQV
jgi:hypothetical protein